MTDTNISPDALREKYEQERLKRLRAEGNAQYVELKTYKDYDADPYTPLIPRDALDIQTDDDAKGALRFRDDGGAVRDGGGDAVPPVTHKS